MCDEDLWIMKCSLYTFGYDSSNSSSCFPFRVSLATAAGRAGVSWLLVVRPRELKPDTQCRSPFGATEVRHHPVELPILHT